MQFDQRATAAQRSYLTALSTDLAMAYPLRRQLRELAEFRGLRLIDATRIIAYLLHDAPAQQGDKWSRLDARNAGVRSSRRIINTLPTPRLGLVVVHKWLPTVALLNLADELNARVLNFIVDKPDERVLVARSSAGRPIARTTRLDVIDDWDASPILHLAQRDNNLWEFANAFTEINGVCAVCQYTAHEICTSCNLSLLAWAREHSIPVES